MWCVKNAAKLKILYNGLSWDSVQWAQYQSDNTAIQEIV